MRELKRSIARANMRDAGMRNINKQRYTAGKKGQIVAVGSIFSRNWREWVNPPKKFQRIIDKARKARA